MVSFPQNRRAPLALLILAPDGDEGWRRAVQRLLQPLEGRHRLRIAWGTVCCNAAQQGLQALWREGAGRVAVLRMFVRDKRAVCGGGSGSRIEGTLERADPFLLRAADASCFFWPVASLGAGQGEIAPAGC